MSATAAPSSTDDSIFLSPEMTGEVIEVWAERPDKVFDRDTALRIDQKQLVERGATNLAEALDLLPDLVVRAAGRGGLQIDVRGARKGSVKILIDGVPIGDPYYGNFDISAIPVTDIEQIRVSSSPGSPIDGTGAPGGVIEVHTRDAVGPANLRMSFEGSSLPTSTGSATARTMLARHWALRMSATGTLGSQDFQVSDGAALLSVPEERSQVMGAARLEYRRGTRRLAIDSWVGTRGYVVPPGEDGSADILDIDSETMTRNSITGDLRLGGWRLFGSTYAQTLRRVSRYYQDPEMQIDGRSEDLRADREGITVLANRPLGRYWHVIGSAVLDSEKARVENEMDEVAGGRASIAQLASGMQFRRGRFDVDAAAGLAIPIGIGARPWPEAKVTGRVRPLRGLELKLIGGHKGRVPTLRERYEGGIGNQALGPEKVLFAELVVEAKPTRWLTTQLASYDRRSNGQIRFDADARQLINLGDLTTRGFEAQLRAFDQGPIGGGALWAFIDADAELGGEDPLDFLPSHRAELWLRGSLGARAGSTLRLRYLGEQIDRGNTLDSRTTVDVSAFARVGEMTGTLRVQNLTDRDYPIRAGVSGPGRVVFFQLQADWK